MRIFRNKTNKLAILPGKDYLGFYLRNREKWHQARNKSMNQVHNKYLILIVSNLCRVYSEEANFGPSLKSMESEIETVMHLNVFQK